MARSRLSRRKRRAPLTAYLIASFFPSPFVFCFDCSASAESIRLPAPCVKAVYEGFRTNERMELRCVPVLVSGRSELASGSKEAAMFFFFSNRVGLLGSILVSAVLTLGLLALCAAG